jgi:dihydropteroate synthase
MGILNLTPDSFSDGGRFNSSERAIARVKTMTGEGADLIDIGAESTRPGFAPISLDTELARLEPLFPQLVEATDLPISIDTTKPEVARRACALGASIVNDIWGLQKDPKMADVVAEAKACIIIMHNRETIEPELDIVGDMMRFFDRSLSLAEGAGIPKEHIMLDPGIGFGKTFSQNLSALHGLDSLRDYALPLLVGVSRKSFLATLLAPKVPISQRAEGACDQNAPKPAPDLEARVIGTLAANLNALSRGASIFRIHDVALHATAFKVFSKIETS